MYKIIKSILTPWGAFGIGFIISLFLLPCTSGPYITILWYLASESSQINTWWYVYILIYNIIFIIPMIIIAIMIAFGYKSVWELKEYKELNVEKLHLVTWVIMLILWIYILSDILL
jgi:cytochrome c biogenesis protein CcdA